MNTLWLGHLVETMQSWENALKSSISYLCVRIPLQCSSMCRVWWSCGWMFPWHAVLTWTHTHYTLCLQAVPPVQNHGMGKKEFNKIHYHIRQQCHVFGPNINVYYSFSGTSIPTDYCNGNTQYNMTGSNDLGTLNSSPSYVVFITEVYQGQSIWSVCSPGRLTMVSQLVAVPAQHFWGWQRVIQSMTTALCPPCWQSGFLVTSGSPTHTRHGSCMSREGRGERGERRVRERRRGEGW